MDSPDMFSQKIGLNRNQPYRSAQPVRISERPHFFQDMGYCAAFSSGLSKAQV